MKIHFFRLLLSGLLVYNAGALSGKAGLDFVLLRVRLALAQFSWDSVR